MAKILLENYFVHYSLPKRMHSDQGRDFESRLVHEVLSPLGVEKSRTMPYHPQGDPQPERFNRTLLDMLGTLKPNRKRKWSQHIGHLVHSYNCMPNKATGFSPYFLMFGREARLLVDLCFDINTKHSTGLESLTHTLTARCPKTVHSLSGLKHSKETTHTVPESLLYAINTLLLLLPHTQVPREYKHVEVMNSYM